MNTISDYCRNHILIIPEALSAASEATPMARSGTSTIFYKALTDDLLNVEFYTKMPCLVYIDDGHEKITSRSGTTFALQPGSALLLPKGVSLRSDYVSASGTLKSYLTFFSDETVEEFLSLRAKPYARPIYQPGKQSPWLVSERFEPITQFFHSVRTLHEAGIDQPELGGVKILELLLILDQIESTALSHALTANGEDQRARRNLTELMANPRILGLTITDLAHLSGRSLSSFNRDFRATFGMSPKKWQIERRLDVAHGLLIESDSSVTDIALRVGYLNTSHFVSTYKTRYACTPSETRNREKMNAHRQG